MTSIKMGSYRQKMCGSSWAMCPSSIPRSVPVLRKVFLLQQEVAITLSRIDCKPTKKFPSYCRDCSAERASAWVTTSLSTLMRTWRLRCFFRSSRSCRPIYLAPRISSATSPTMKVLLVTAMRPRSKAQQRGLPALESWRSSRPCLSSSLIKELIQTLNRRRTYLSTPKSQIPLSWDPKIP